MTRAMTKEPIYTTWTQINEFIHEVKPAAYITFAMGVARDNDRNKRAGITTIPIFELQYRLHLNIGYVLGKQIKFAQFMCNN